jgi:TPR repeat protein
MSATKRPAIPVRRPRPAGAPGIPSKAPARPPPLPQKKKRKPAALPERSRRSEDKKHILQTRPAVPPRRRSAMDNGSVSAVEVKGRIPSSGSQAKPPASSESKIQIAQHTPHLGKRPAPTSSVQTFPSSVVSSAPAQARLSQDIETQFSPITSLCDDIWQMCVKDKQTMARSYELGALCVSIMNGVDGVSLSKQESSASVALLQRLQATKSTLNKAKQLMTSALAARFRRGAKFNDKLSPIVDELSAHSASMVVNTTGLPSPLTLTHDLALGMQEMLEGDRAYFGHGEPANLPKALKLYKVAFEKGNVAAMNCVGSIYLNGNGVSRDVKKALKAYLRAAELGSSVALNTIGTLYEKGEGSVVKKDLHLARKYYTRGAESGNPDAMMNLGYILEHGCEAKESFIAEDVDSAISWYRKAAALGSLQAQNNLGSLYFSGAGTLTGDPDFATALSYYTSAADGGYAPAQHNMGVLYETGKGVQVDLEEATQYYKAAALGGFANSQCSYAYMCFSNGGYKDAYEFYSRAAEQRNPEALHRLGMMYLRGLHVPISSTSAVASFKKATELQYPESYLQLAHCYYNGIGLPKDVAQAFLWYKRAAIEQIPEAMNCVAILYESGLGVVRSYDEALYWYKKASEESHAEATFNVGLLYERARGVARNMDLAFKFYTTAAEQGSVSAKVRLEQEKLVQQKRRRV